jgi:hypothetical protein
MSPQLEITSKPEGIVRRHQNAGHLQERFAPNETGRWRRRFERPFVPNVFGQACGALVHATAYCTGASTDCSAASRKVCLSELRSQPLFRGIPVWFFGSEQESVNTCVFAGFL